MYNILKDDKIIGYIKEYDKSYILYGVTLYKPNTIKNKDTVIIDNIKIKVKNVDTEGRTIEMPKETFYEKVYVTCYLQHPNKR